MAFPRYPEIEEALVETLRGMGGEASCSDVIDKLADHFGLTPEERRIKDNGQYKFTHMCHTARARLVRKGVIAKDSPTAIWRLVKGPSPPPLPPDDEPDKLAEEIKRLLGKLVESAKKGKEETPHPTHYELLRIIKEMGEMLGKSTEPVPQAQYRHDCVWRPNRWANPELVWEVCDRGVLEKDIVSLTWARDTWRAKGILVLFEETDFGKAQERFAHLSQIYLIRAEDVVQLHRSLKAGNSPALKAILGI